MLKTSDKRSAALREKVMEIVARVLGNQYEPGQLVKYVGSILPAAETAP